MPIPMDEDVARYFHEHSSVWRERVGESASYRDAVGSLEGLETHEATEVVAVALGYLSDANNRIVIYQRALEMLRAGETESRVDAWLSTVGFPVQHNSLGPRLVQRIASLFQSMLHVVQNFVRNVVGTLPWTLDSVTFRFSVSPGVDVKFI